MNRRKTSTTSGKRQREIGEKMNLQRINRRAEIAIGQWALRCRHIMNIDIDDAANRKTKQIDIMLFAHFDYFFSLLNFCCCSSPFDGHMFSIYWTLHMMMIIQWILQYDGSWTANRTMRVYWIDVCCVRMARCGKDFAHARVLKRQTQTYIALVHAGENCSG